MHYLSRLGLFGGSDSAFPSHDALVKATRQHGQPLMELLAIDMRSRGAYLARQLSFHGVVLEQHVAHMTHHQRRVYDELCSAVRGSTLARGLGHQSFFQRLSIA